MHRQRFSNAILAMKNIVLVYNISRKTNMFRHIKLQYHWLGSFVIVDIKDKGIYILRIPAGISVERTFPLYRIKKFLQIAFEYWKFADQNNRQLNGDFPTITAKDEREDDTKEDELLENNSFSEKKVASSNDESDQNSPVPTVIATIRLCERIVIDISIYHRFRK